MGRKIDLKREVETAQLYAAALEVAMEKPIDYACIDTQEDSAEVSAFAAALQAQSTYVMTLIAAKEVLR